MSFSCRVLIVPVPIVALSLDGRCPSPVCVPPQTISPCTNEVYVQLLDSSPVHGPASTEGTEGTGRAGRKVARGGYPPSPGRPAGLGGSVPTVPSVPSGRPGGGEKIVGTGGPGGGGRVLGRNFVQILF